MVEGTLKLPVGKKMIIKNKSVIWKAMMACESSAADSDTGDNGIGAWSAKRSIKVTVILGSGYDTGAAWLMPGVHKKGAESNVHALPSSDVTLTVSCRVKARQALPTLP